MNYKALDRIIKEKGTTRRKLAIKAGISPTTLNSAFNNDSQTGIINTPQTVKRFAEILGVSVDELLSDDEREVISSGRLRGHHLYGPIHDMYDFNVPDEIKRLRQLDKEWLLTDGVLRLLKTFFEMDDYHKRKLIEYGESRLESSLKDKENLADRFSKRDQEDDGKDE